MTDSGRHVPNSDGLEEAVAADRSRAAPSAPSAGTLALQPHLQEEFIAIEAVLRQFPVNVVMAGGSILAAHFGHRWSTDIDLFISTDHGFKDDTPSSVLHDGIVSALREAGLTETEFKPKVSPNLIGFRTATPSGVPYSLFESAYLIGHPPNGPWVEGTSIRAATHPETLLGKLLGRTMNALNREQAGSPAVPIRDVYDLAVMAYVDPRTLEGTLDSLSPDERRSTYEVYRYLPPDLHEIDPSPIISGQYAFEDMAGLPKAVALFIRDGDISHIPPPSSVPPSPARGDARSTALLDEGTGRRRGSSNGCERPP